VAGPDDPSEPIEPSDLPIEENGVDFAWLCVEALTP
jgi:hypothetical protein